ncbi:hypothetical protein NADE_006850 [Nannochloris sp. 'desiccata']|nr:hypothetical protein NADE_006850 [Chlorella desiccata (nom. nud.)]
MCPHDLNFQNSASQRSEIEAHSATCNSLLSRHAVPDGAHSGRKAYDISRRRLAELQLNGLDTNFRLFDVTVKSVLGYGAEVWAPELLCNDALSNYCERVHLFDLKWLWGVRKSTASCIVLAETGRRGHSRCCYLLD